MRSAKKKNLLLINGFASPTAIIDELLSQPVSDSNIYLSYPLGVLTLAGWCRQEFPCFDIKIVDAMMELHKQISKPARDPVALDDFIAAMLETVAAAPDYIGISLSFSNGHKACLRLCRACKARWPGATLIVGGVHATTFTHRIITEPSIDYVIRGPGDAAFVDLLACLLEGRDPAPIAGIVRDSDSLASMAPPP